MDVRRKLFALLAFIIPAIAPRLVFDLGKFIISRLYKQQSWTLLASFVAFAAYSFYCWHQMKPPVKYDPIKTKEQLKEVIHDILQWKSARTFFGREVQAGYKNGCILVKVDEVLTDRVAVNVKEFSVAWNSFTSSIKKAFS